MQRIILIYKPPLPPQKKEDSLQMNTDLFTTQQPCTSTATCWRDLRTAVASIPWGSRANSWLNLITFAEINKFTNQITRQ